MQKRIKIFKSTWHIAHDHALITALKDVADFSLLINYTRRWDERARPLPDNVEWVTHFEAGKYDLAILNVDQQCSSPNMNKAILPKHMKQAIEEADPACPIIFINHATPVYPEHFPDGTRETEYVSEILKKEILDIVDGRPMVVNSYQAAKDWGYGHPIIHGMDPEFFKPREDTIKEPRAVTFITGAGVGDKYYNRSYLVAVIEELREKYGIKLHWVNMDGNFCAKNFREYSEFIAGSAVYFNPTFASPMPRSRTEAMLYECAIITTPQHDADTFIKDGYNGFIVPHNNVEYTAKLIDYLVKDGYQLAVEMGKNARKTAIEKFSPDRYRDDWIAFLKEHKIL